MALSTGAMIGLGSIGPARDILESSFGFNLGGPGSQIQKEQDFYEKQIRRRQRSPEAGRLRGLAADFSQRADEVPRLARRNLEGSLSSRAQEEQSRISESLASAGVTEASDIGSRARRGLMGDLEGQRQQGEFGIENLTTSLQQSAIGANRSVLDALFPSPGQSAAGLGQSMGQFTDPLNNIAQMMALFGLQGGKGGGNNGGGGTTNFSLFG